MLNDTVLHGASAVPDETSGEGCSHGAKLCDERVGVVAEVIPVVGGLAGDHLESVRLQVPLEGPRRVGRAVQMRDDPV